MHVAPWIVVHCCPLLLSTADIIDCLKMARSLELFNTVSYVLILRQLIGRMVECPAKEFSEIKILIAPILNLL